MFTNSPGKEKKWGTGPDFISLTEESDGCTGGLMCLLD